MCVRTGTGFDAQRRLLCDVCPAGIHGEDGRELQYREVLPGKQGINIWCIWCTVTVIWNYIGYHRLLYFTFRLHASRDIPCATCLVKHASM